MRGYGHVAELFDCITGGGAVSQSCGVFMEWREELWGLNFELYQQHVLSSDDNMSHNMSYRPPHVSNPYMSSLL